MKIIGGVITGYGYCKTKGLDFLAYLDLIVPVIALAQGFGRIGCFGRETDSVLE
ncbi:prolipoprotein diacylglyceryl transferase family protein [Clostridium magnum]|uniref:prolipoprotein diacylglyceryl transferase family protein n=1 Tax=Clostridium magnum TaxID=33954 RepID=UPI0009EEF73B